ncbi:pyridoxal-dependent decarboxylase [Streptomyces fungicidicus]|uniref:pyridoxal-dependent decarboxylase n=1 Tax=Streptomyces fungicidicus TaxID=68203 RepID=UPI0033F453B9
MSARSAVGPFDADLAIRDLPADGGRRYQPVGAPRGEGPSMLGFLGFALEGLAPLLNGGVNQVGDPYTPDAWASGARAYEVAVLEYFAQVAGALPGEVCGYVASSSGEALLQGLAAAQRRLPEACVYTSDQAHDSVRRACELVRMELVTVGSLPGGRMDPEELRLQALQRRGRGGAVVVATFGTTMRGAVDDVRVLRAAGGECIAVTDRTPACSCSDLACLLLWARLRSLGRAAVAALVGRC